MYLLIVFGLLITGLLLSHSVDNNKLTKHIKKIEFLYVLIGVFVGVFLALYFTNVNQRSIEKENLCKLLQSSHSELIGIIDSWSKVIDHYNAVNNGSVELKLDEYFIDFPLPSLAITSSLLENDLALRYFNQQSLINAYRAKSNYESFARMTVRSGLSTDEWSEVKKVGVNFLNVIDSYLHFAISISEW